MEIFVWAAHVLLAVVLIILVLLQHGKGADMGAAFGSGSAGSLFGASGSANFLSRATSMTAALFFATSMGLTYLSANQTKDTGMTSIMDQIEESAVAPVGQQKKPVVGNDTDDSDISSKSKADQIPE
ncbi:preprotein translocase subunit SecG [Nitrosomonas sp. JL21]|uniref:preprotein translocase subunit SecG n=1 Tax=Nitrosomonas sp. JL21 TaxID=153949 RepID=UPI001371D2EB|nr:preprotein translocase subunit SecG [Nitrosomonas sp. JL21]MBL8498664.1 preprotein translocase subunit SecG [Nitrosomonas sp.]MXS77502.1 preprotein translocase subunit SecG [Nitrosomonas sp. JL21]